MDSEMITRSAKRKSTHLGCNSLVLKVPGSDIQIRSQSSISVETSGYVPPGNEQFQKPICNIHIYSPSHEISTIKLSMPGIQPLIPICPNKIIQGLEYNIGNESRKLTPILDGMELSSANNLAGRNYLELGNSTLSQRLTDNMTEDTNKVKDGSPKSSKNSCNSNKSSKNNNSTAFKNSKEISSCRYDTNSIKLNKAVVVLTDICKSKYYKAAFADYLAKNQVKTSEIETREDISGPVLKQENETSSTGVIDDQCTNTIDTTFDTGPSSESIYSTPLCGSRLLTQLAEGCNFSEILNRFRIKNGNCLVDTLKSADTLNHENFKTECLEDHENQTIKSETFSLYEDEGTMENLLTSDITEKVEKTDFKDINLLGLPQGSEYEKSREDIEHLRNQSLDSHVKSDPKENTTAVQSISGYVSADEETVDSSCLTTKVVSDGCKVTTSEQICNMSEKNSNHLSNTSNSDLNMHESGQSSLEMDRERMKNKKFLGVSKSKSKKNKRPRLQNTSPSPHHSSSPKKKKQSKQKSKTSHKNKTKMPNEYIPLQASGPTKFGVAMLHQIKPYVHHDAKDFKAKMLFGERNRRVTSSEEFRMYKLKQKVNRSLKG